MSNSGDEILATEVHNIRLMSYKTGNAQLVPCYSKLPQDAFQYIQLLLQTVTNYNIKPYMQLDTTAIIQEHTPSHMNGEGNVCIMFSVIFRVHYGPGTNTVGCMWTLILKLFIAVFVTFRLDFV